MKILVWKSKHGDVMVFARDPEEEARAWLYLFRQMYEMDYYCDLEGDEPEAYAAAKAGDAKGAEWLLQIRNGYEYEVINEEYPVEP